VPLAFIDESDLNALPRLEGRLALRLGAHDVVLIAPN
jgi:hypothetical protein